MEKNVVLLVNRASVVLLDDPFLPQTVGVTGFVTVAPLDTRGHLGSDVLESLPQKMGERKAALLRSCQIAKP